MADDLEGAKKRWPEMRRWVFVHNDLFGFSAEVTRGLESLRSDTSNVNLEILSDWDPEDLWRIVRNLPYGDRLELLGGPQAETVAEEPGWDGFPLRYHDEVNPAATRAAMASLSQLCGNFQHDSVLDPICASATARAITSWWLQDEDSFKTRRSFSVTSNSWWIAAMPYRGNRRSLPSHSLIRTLEICARELEMPPEVLADSQIRGEVDLPEGLESSCR